eukprot:6451339-Amphidinium_carterae.1
MFMLSEWPGQPGEQKQHHAILAITWQRTYNREILPMVQCAGVGEVNGWFPEILAHPGSDPVALHR